MQFWPNYPSQFFSFSKFLPIWSDQKTLLYVDAEFSLTDLQLVRSQFYWTSSNSEKAKTLNYFKLIKLILNWTVLKILNYFAIFFRSLNWIVFISNFALFLSHNYDLTISFMTFPGQNFLFNYY